MEPTIIDGKETVELYGQTVDVTGKDSFTLFKREYKIVRPKAKEEKMDSKSSKPKTKGDE